MNTQQVILAKFTEFQTFLNSIDKRDLQALSRSELIELENQLHHVKHRSLAFEISEIIKEKKIEEFPELLGIHHYPDLKEITFLSESTKLNIDKHLVKLRVGNYVNRLYDFARDNERLQQLEDFLIEKGIVESLYIIKCPHCSHGHLSKSIDKKTLNTLKERIQSIKEDDECSIVAIQEEELLEYFCMDCERDVDFKILKTEYGFIVSKVLKLSKERDDKYDNM